MLARSQITDDNSKEILLKEIEILQKVFDKYNDWIFKTRAGCVTAVLALLSISFSKTQTDLRILAVFVPPVAWVLEGMIRWDHLYGYVKRYITINKFLNESDVTASIYINNLKDYRNHKLNTWKELLTRDTLHSSFLKKESGIFYLFMLLLCILSFGFHLPI